MIVNVWIKPLVRIQGHEPLAGAAVKHGVPGSGKIIDPWEIKQSPGHAGPGQSDSAGRPAAAGLRNSLSAA